MNDNDKANDNKPEIDVNKMIESFDGLLKLNMQLAKSIEIDEEDRLVFSLYMTNFIMRSVKEAFIKTDDSESES